jgi:hypothetical protein
MSGGIFLLQDGGQLIEMTGQPYDSEKLLQELLAQYPALLAGDQIDNMAPRQWLLVSRELALQSEPGSGSTTAARRGSRCTVRATSRMIRRR